MANSQSVQTNRDEIPVVHVISETESQWAIRCPYCQEVHYHGKIEGHRVAQCLNPGPENRGYIVRNSKP